MRFFALWIGILLLAGPSPGHAGPVPRSILCRAYLARAEQRRGLVNSAYQTFRDFRWKSIHYRQNENWIFHSNQLLASFSEPSSHALQKAGQTIRGMEKLIETSSRTPDRHLFGVSLRGERRIDAFLEEVDAEIREGNNFWRVLRSLPFQLDFRSERYAGWIQKLKTQEEASWIFRAVSSRLETIVIPEGEILQAGSVEESWAPVDLIELLQYDPKAQEGERLRLDFLVHHSNEPLPPKPRDPWILVPDYIRFRQWAPVPVPVPKHPPQPPTGPR